MKKIKGFTLIECIIAIAILGIASLTMAQIYAGISKTNLNNNLINTSLSYQMKMVEKKTNSSSDTIKIDSGEAALASPTTEPPHHRSSATKNIKVTKLDSTGAPTNQVYSYPVDTYVLLSRDKNDKPSSDSNSTIDENDIALRYKFIIGS